jgi:hypothetical protein
MSDQEKFEKEAAAITQRYQAEMDMKMYLSHWTGYAELRGRHEKDIYILARKYNVEFNYKKWTLDGHWMA